MAQKLRALATLVDDLSCASLCVRVFHLHIYMCTTYVQGPWRSEEGLGLQVVVSPHVDAGT